MQTGIPDRESGSRHRISPVNPVVTRGGNDGLLNSGRVRIAGPPKKEVNAENTVVFVIENSAEYMYQIEQAFRKAALPVDLKIARYGNEAVLYLKGVGIYGDRSTYPLPNIILLDLDLPDGSPLAVLGWIRQQTNLSNITVLTAGSQNQPNLFKMAREMGAQAFFPKNDLTGIINTIQSLIRTDEHHAVAA
jgi:CheY-like chemotaxis protein